jgi:hypothetical protein
MKGGPVTAHVLRFRQHESSDEATRRILTDVFDGRRGERVRVRRERSREMERRNELVESLVRSAMSVRMDTLERFSRSFALVASVLGKEGDK